MKKIIALLLALVMTFSVATIAFAADETTAPEAGTETEVPEGDLAGFEWLLDLPLWTAKPLLKIAKIALKLVKVYLKLSEVFGNIPEGVADRIEQVIKDVIENAEKGNEAVTTPVIA